MFAPESVSVLLLPLCSRNRQVRWIGKSSLAVGGGAVAKLVNCPGCSPRLWPKTAGRRDQRSSPENGLVNGWTISTVITMEWLKNSMKMYFSHEECAHKRGHSAKCVEIGWCHYLVGLVKGTSAGSLEVLSSLKQKSCMGKEFPLHLASCGPSTGCWLCVLTVSHIS